MRRFEEVLKVPEVVINEVCPDEMEELFRLSIETLKTIHKIATKVSIEKELPLSEHVRLEYEILMKYVAYLLDTYLKITHAALNALEESDDEDDDLEWRDVM